MTQPDVEIAEPKRLTRGQVTCIAAVFLGYAALSHYSNSVPEARGLGAVLSFGPLFVIGVMLLWRWTRPLIALAAAAVAGAATLHYWTFLESHFEMADLVQQCGAYGLIAVIFAHSLGAPREPVCARLAREVHGTLGRAEITYTRIATLAWALLYFSIAAAIAILYFVATPRTWSLFVNFGSFAILIIACVADFSLRHWLLPRRPGSGIFAMLQQTLLGTRP